MTANVFTRIQQDYDIWNSDLPEFDQWLAAIKDKTALIRLTRRLDRAQHGQFGDIKAVGDGVFEMREHFGSGWRMYYVQRGFQMIVMLGGGDKSSQADWYCQSSEIG